MSLNQMRAIVIEQPGPPERLQLPTVETPVPAADEAPKIELDIQIVPA